MLPATKCCFVRGDICNEKTSPNLPLAKPKQNAEKIFKIYELFIYGDTHFITSYFVEICQNSDTATQVINFFISFSYCYQYIFAHDVYKNIQLNYNIIIRRPILINPSSSINPINLITSKYSNI